jgi:folate-binding protein YgfZ
MSAASEQFGRFLKAGGIADLTDRLKLRLTGADRTRFLNGQVTANVHRLAPGDARPACVTTAKGKLNADVFLHATDDALFLDADAAVRESLPSRIERYIVADDVVLEDVSDSYRLLHLLGPVAGCELPAGIAFAARTARFGGSGRDLWIEPRHFDEVLAVLSNRAPILDEPFLESIRIEHGIPRWARELGENTLPPEAGLDRTHIDYDKGCYIGQEVISRIKSVGHVNRRLVGFKSDNPLAPGMRAYSEGAEVGTLTSTAWSFRLEKFVALGYLKRGSPMGELLARSADETGGGRLVVAFDFPISE